MATRRVVISGLGPISGLGAGIESTWSRLNSGDSAVGPIRVFDPAGFGCQVAAEVEGFEIRNHVPKSYRKATKVMARDIELAVGAADLAARDAGLVTHGRVQETSVSPTYPSSRMGVHVGAGLISAQLDELTAALAEATDEHGRFDYHKWGREGITHLTPLWLLKYLPNMLACHVTIIHDAQGPSNTITCGEASATLSIGESFRVIQRGAADLCFCGGAESKLNLMTYLRQEMTGRLNTEDNDNPARSVRPFCQTAAGTVVGEGGGIVILEAVETYGQRAPASPDGGTRPYAEVLGFGASQTVNPDGGNLEPDAQGRGIAVAIRAAMRDAGVEPGQIDLIIPFGSGVPSYDQAEAAALAGVFGDHLVRTPVASVKAAAGTCGAGVGGLDVCVAAAAVAYQTVPAIINCDRPRAGLNAGSAPARACPLNHVLVYSTGLGGQNAALVLGRWKGQA